MIWDMILDVVIIFCLISGLFFFFVGVVGLIRMPDVFTRMHATTKCDTMGAGLIGLGLILWQGFTFVSFSILLILIFIWITTPTAAHAIAKTAYYRMQKEKEGEQNGDS